MTILRTPILGICLPECWYRTTCPRLGSPYLFPFPDRLRVWADNGGYAVYAVTASPAGRGFGPIYDTGGYCSGTDTYIDSSNGYVDVWRAYQDGIWTSSVNIEVRVAASSAFSPAVLCQPHNGYTASTVCEQGYKQPCPADTAAACPTTLSATITVYDDGSYAIA